MGGSHRQACIRFYSVLSRVSSAGSALPETDLLQDAKTGFIFRRKAAAGLSRVRMDLHAASLQALKRGSRASFRHGEQGEWYRGQVSLSEDEALLTCAKHDALAWLLSWERQRTDGDGHVTVQLADVAHVECLAVPGRGESMRLLLTSTNPSSKLTERLAEPHGAPGVPPDLFVLFDGPKEAQVITAALLELVVARGLLPATVDGDAEVVVGQGEGEEEGAQQRLPSMGRVFSPKPGAADENSADCWLIAEALSPTTKLVVEAIPAKLRNGTGREGTHGSDSAQSAPEKDAAAVGTIPSQTHSDSESPAAAMAAMVARFDWASVDWERVRRAVRAKSQLEALAEAWLANRSEGHFDEVRTKGCSKMCWRLQPRVLEAATTCARGCKHVVVSTCARGSNHLSQVLQGDEGRSDEANSVRLRADKAVRLGAEVAVMGAASEAAEAEAAAAAKMGRAQRHDAAGAGEFAAEEEAEAGREGGATVALPGAREAAWREAVQEDSLRVHAAVKKMERDEAWKMVSIL